MHFEAPIYRRCTLARTISQRNETGVKGCIQAKGMKHEVSMKLKTKKKKEKKKIADFSEHVYITLPFFVILLDRCFDKL